MRRAVMAIVLIALALPLVAPFVRGLVFIAVLAALTVTVLVVAGRRIRRSGASMVPWVVSLVVGVVKVSAEMR